MFCKDNVLFFLMAFHLGLAKTMKWNSQRQKIGYTLGLLPSSRECIPAGILDHMLSHSLSGLSVHVLPDDIVHLV